MKRAVWLLVVIPFLGCGYAPAYGGQRPTERLSPELAPARMAYPQAAAGVIAGARVELSRAGVLGSTGGYPRLLIEVVRVDEAASGIAAVEPLPGEDLAPLGRGSAVAVTARGWVIERPGGPPVRDTGDVRRVEHVATAAEPVSDGENYDAAVRAAARRVGRALARRVLGVAEPTIEPM